MQALALNIIIALIWTLLTTHFTMSNFLIGLFLGYIILWWVRWTVHDKKYFTKVLQSFSFFFYFIFELVKANLRVAHDVITPTDYSTPGIIRIPLDVKTDLEITLLSMVITLTPGTLTLDVSPDKKWIYVHFMFIDDLETARKEIKEGFESKIIELFR
jgi:multicomponent Na+:H+ antiporter subunit E